MKTIFITCFNGFISRNILSTDAFLLLKEKGDIRVVIFSPEKRALTLREEYGGANIIIEGIEIASKTIENPIERFMWVLATNLLRTKTRHVQRRVKFARDNNVADYLFSVAISFLGRFVFVRNMYRYVESRIVPGTEFEKYFDKYRPNLIFAADVYTPQDVKIMRCAKRRGVSTAGMVRSWDNVTSKTLLSHIPDYMVVNSDRVKEEVVRYGGMPPERVFAVGVPHYDRYTSANCLLRESFLKERGLDNAKKMILFATPGDNYLENNPITPLVLESLKDIDANIFVRLPLVGKEELGGGYVPPKNVVFDDPGNYQNFTQVHMTDKADRHLANCINASDIVITWASTMILDAAVFNKPIILVGFDGTPRPYQYGIARYYDYEHHQFILKSGGVRLVKSPEELIHWVKRYLAEPSFDKEGRKKIIKEYCGDMDGSAGRRLGNFLLEKLKN
ncbi:MAG: CDP-glycerol glycerophosphotransferase family protein [bacterium]|nr:CDP-glycerol glycerophosphotransferase family protein [bacterium]